MRRLLTIAALALAGCALPPLTPEQDRRILNDALEQQRLERTVELLETRDQRFKRPPHF